MSLFIKQRNAMWKEHNEILPLVKTISKLSIVINYKKNKKILKIKSPLYLEIYWHWLVFQDHYPYSLNLQLN